MKREIVWSATFGRPRIKEYIDFSLVKKIIGSSLLTILKSLEVEEVFSVDLCIYTIYLPIDIKKI